ncbi:hypothetical protein FACS1894217_00850 [Clostridia bacterium]|nr:hypothetical protein FACS1894217_00850 [Clostridia bacterium]
MLSKRLQAVADIIPGGLRVIDVGADHGKLAAHLALTGRSVIAADLRREPLERGRSYAESVGAAVDFRLGDGLSITQPSEVDAIVIAGMGGETIAEILGAATWSRDKLCVLQPASKAERLRRFCCENGYKIRKERVICDAGRWYPVLQTERGDCLKTSPGYHFISSALRLQATGDVLLYADKTIKWLHSVLPSLRGDPRHAGLAEYYQCALVEILEWRNGF